MWPRKLSPKAGSKLSVPIFRKRKHSRGQQPRRECHPSLCGGTIELDLFYVARGSKGKCDHLLPLRHGGGERTERGDIFHRALLNETGIAMEGGAESRSPSLIPTTQNYSASYGSFSWIMSIRRTTSTRSSVKWRWHWMDCQEVRGVADFLWSLPRALTGIWPPPSCHRIIARSLQAKTLCSR